MATAEPPDERSNEAKKSRWKESSERKGRDEGRWEGETGNSQEGAIGMRERRARDRKRKRKKKRENEREKGRRRGKERKRRTEESKVSRYKGA